MGLTIHFLLTFLIELPIIGLFFKKKKRPNAYKYGALINLISWPIMEILRLMIIDRNLTISFAWLQLVIAIGEGIAYWIFLDCGWKRAFMISLVANFVCYLITKNIPYDLEFLTSKAPPSIH